MKWSTHALYHALPFSLVVRRRFGYAEIGGEYIVLSMIFERLKCDGEPVVDFGVDVMFHLYTAFTQLGSLIHSI